MCGRDLALVSVPILKTTMLTDLPPVPKMDQWRLGDLGHLLTARGDAFYDGSDTEKFTMLIDNLCSI